MSAKKRITIKEIAEKANVSIGTVDRVIHNRGKVSEEKERLIRKIMEEENYKPNIFARNLKLAKTYIIGVLIPEPARANHYWELPVQGIKQAAEELSNRNIKIKFFHFDKSSVRDFNQVCNKIEFKNLDGILMAPVLYREFSKFLQKIPDNLPYVFIDSTVPEADNLAYIGQNSFDSGLTAGKLMKLLVTQKSDIAIIKIVPEDYHIEERIKGFTTYLNPSNKYKFKIYGVEESDSIEKYARIMDKVTRENKNLKGIFVPSANVFHIARYIKNNMKENNISVIGYDLLEENKRFLKQNIIDFIIDQAPKDQGLLGIKTLYKYLVFKEKPSREIIMPINIATRENMDYF